MVLIHHTHQEVEEQIHMVLDHLLALEREVDSSAGGTAALQNTGSGGGGMERAPGGPFSST